VRYPISLHISPAGAMFSIFTLADPFHAPSHTVSMSHNYYKTVGGTTDAFNKQYMNSFLWAPISLKATYLPIPFKISSMLQPQLSLRVGKICP